MHLNSNVVTNNKKNNYLNYPVSSMKIERFVSVQESLVSVPVLLVLELLFVGVHQPGHLRVLQLYKD